MSRRHSLLFLIVIALFAPMAVAQVPAAPPPPPDGPGRLCCAPVPAGLADWWLFDEPSGPTSADIAGSVNNVGTDQGSVTRIAGVVGRAASFNNASIDVADQAEVNFLGDCEPGTIDFWIRTTANGGTVPVLDKRQSSSNFLRGYSVYLWNGQIGFQMANGPGNSSCGSTGSACDNFTSPFKVADGKWHFVAIAFTRCGTPAGTFFVDGNPPSSFTPRTGPLVNTAPLQIGRRAASMGGGFFPGALDELEIFKRALTVAELNNIYRAGPAGKCRQLVPQP